MTVQQIYAHTQKAEIKKIGQKSMAVLPLKIWQEIEDYIEDMEAAQSKTLAKKIKQARSEKKAYSLEAMKKKLNL